MQLSPADVAEISSTLTGAAGLAAAQAIVYEDFRETAALKTMLPWLIEHVEEAEALMGAEKPEQATAAFEWARDKDPTYPDASFNLAKQTALAGEIPETVKHLQEVHKRGGKKLLKQVSYDPVFEAVKDDPEVQKIAK